MTNKYIIKNCPAMTDQGNCFQGSLFLGTAYRDCEERTDCLLKQIVDKTLSVKGYDPLVKDILSMLEIQERENE